MAKVAVAAFRPRTNNCVNVAVTDASGATAVQITDTDGTLADEVMVYNAGSNPCAIAVGPSDATVDYPSSAGYANRKGLVIPPGVTMVLGFGAHYLAAECATGLTTTLFVTPGEGV